MTASELFQAGHLRAAIDAQIQKVKANAADQGARFFLFELFLFAGDMDRARKQLDVLRYDKPEALAAIEAFRKALDAETARRAVLSGRARPKFLKDVPPHAELRLSALAAYAAGNVAGGDALLDQANAEAPAVAGQLNDESVPALRDADDLFGTILEVFGGAEYCWVPLEQVEALTMNPVATPRDVVWRPANLALHDGPEGDVLLVGLYAGSHAHADEAVALGRVTDWIGADDAPTRGAGSRLFVAGDKWVGLNDWRTLHRPD